MRLTSRLSVLAHIALPALLAAHVASAQAGLGGSFRGSADWSTYSNSGGGNVFGQSWTGGAANDGHFDYFPSGGTSQHGQGVSQAAFGFLQGAAHAQAYNGQYRSQAGFITSAHWFDHLTILTPGQLIFSLALTGSSNLNPNVPSPQCFAFLGGLTSSAASGMCALEAAQFEVNGNPFDATRSQFSTGGHPGWPDQGPQTVTVTAGEVLPIAGYFIAIVHACEWQENFCRYPDGGGAKADAEGSARFFISSEGGASFTSDSGESYSPLVTTPEPASMVLLGTGLVGVFCVARRKRSPTAA